MAISLAVMRQQCPVDIDRVISHAYNFNSSVNVRISQYNLNKAKKSLIQARGHLDLMVTTLHQVLYNRDILVTRTDEILHLWMIDNLGRFLRTIDLKEDQLLVTNDYPQNDKLNKVGVSSLSVYAKMLKTAGESLVYESLFKAIQEYNSLEDSEKEPRKFLYILFMVLQITLSALGGLARQSSGGVVKKGMVSENPTSWQSMMSSGGQESIAKEHEEKTGEKVNIDSALLKNATENEVIHHEEYDEESGEEPENE